MVSGRDIREVLQGDAAGIKAPSDLWDMIRERLEDTAREKTPTFRLTPQAGVVSGGWISLRRRSPR